jgi:hypothetical protein
MYGGEQMTKDWQLKHNTEIVYGSANSLSGSGT